MVEAREIGSHLSLLDDRNGLILDDLQGPDAERAAGESAPLPDMTRLPNRETDNDSRFQRLTRLCMQGSTVDNALFACEIPVNPFEEES
ncbi:MAG: hypothetical protein QUS11_04640 [Candidatus Fermentibacter sp.]|nr:hypothetical protein [Candidatus Fermentibacter sp.]